MAKKKQKSFRPKPRLPKGMRDIPAMEVRALREMFDKLSKIYELYGFEPLDTPAFEYSDCLGKFLPDQDRPNQGVFSFEEEEGAWVSLRYDLTAPLSRYVAENYDQLAKPFRRYQMGPVWRNEKPGPGRFRQFIQFDADSVGAPSLAADAEMAMLGADALEGLGIPHGSYQIRINNRKILDGVLALAGLDIESGEASGQKLTVLRAIDKLDRLGGDGVAQLLGTGRKDESGDFTKGADLSTSQIDKILSFIACGDGDRSACLKNITDLVRDSELGAQGVDELAQINALLTAAGYDNDCIIIDPTIVRGLDYYTGPVMEAELTFESKDEDGTMQRFGSVGGGGRYDGLIARFKGIEVPATGFSIGISRLYSALDHLGKLSAERDDAPVVVLVMDHDQLPKYQKMVHQLRQNDIKSELYLGLSGMRAQMKYADKRGAKIVVIQGEDEREGGFITLKDLDEGARMSAEIEDNKEWREGRPAQISIKENELVEAVKTLQQKQKGGS